MADHMKQRDKNPDEENPTEKPKFSLSLKESPKFNVSLKEHTVKSPIANMTKKHRTLQSLEISDDDDLAREQQVIKTQTSAKHS